MHFPPATIARARTRRIIAWLAPLFPIVLTACGPEPASSSSLDAARRFGLRAGFAIERPYAFVDSAGRITGEAPEILRLGAAGAGIAEVEWVPLDFPELIPALLGGRIDVIAAGLFDTPARRERVAFSLPTACVAPLLVTRGGDCVACRIAVITGSVEHAALRETHQPAGKVMVMPDIATAIAGVRGASADALAISAPTAREIAAAEDLNVVAHAFPANVARAASGCASFAFRPGDRELIAAVDSALVSFIGTPAHLRLAQRFGFAASEIPCPADPSMAGSAAPGCVSPPPRPRRR